MIISKQVKFYWFKSYKIWIVKGDSIDQIMKRCDELCAKYHALHYEIL